MNFNENNVFSEDAKTDRILEIISESEITDYAGYLSSDVSEEAKEKGKLFSKEISERFVTDFEKTEALVLAGKVAEADKMVHVSTFTVIDGMIYMTYYANTKEPSEDPRNQTARFVYCPANDTENKVFMDIQSAGDEFSGKKIDMVYDTILMPRDDNTVFIMWTARVESNYYRFYRSFDIPTKSLGEVRINRFAVKNTVNDFSISGIKSTLAENGIPCKTMYSDIGIMQKLSSRIENGKKYYYSGAYSGDFNCIIKSDDLVTWEYVAQPDFINLSKWENATYVINDKCYYFVRQKEPSKYGFLTAYDLTTGKWDKSVIVDDCQSRSDFIYYGGELYLFHAPIDRNHIGIIKIDTENIANSSIVLQADMNGSCFYPFVQYFDANELAMSYTVDRKHIRLAKFDMNKFIK